VKIIDNAMKIIPPIVSFFQANIVIPIKMNVGIKCMNKATMTSGNLYSVNTSIANNEINSMYIIDRTLGAQ